MPHLKFFYKKKKTKKTPALGKGHLDLFPLAYSLNFLEIKWNGYELVVLPTMMISASLGAVVAPSIPSANSI